MYFHRFLSNPLLAWGNKISKEFEMLLREKSPFFAVHIEKYVGRFLCYKQTNKKIASEKILPQCAVGSGFSYGPPILLETLFMLEATLANSPIADSKRIEAELVRIPLHIWEKFVCFIYRVLHLTNILGSPKH